MIVEGVATMTWFFAVLIVLVLGAVAVVAAGRGDHRWVRRTTTAPTSSLPGDRHVTGDDLRALRFNTALRGYRASEVDAMIERLAAQLDDRRGGPIRPEAGIPLRPCGG